MNSQSECASGIRLNFLGTLKNYLKRNGNGEVAEWNISLFDRDLRIGRKPCATVGVTDFERFLNTIL